MNQNRYMQLIMALTFAIPILSCSKEKTATPVTTDTTVVPAPVTNTFAIQPSNWQLLPNGEYKNSLPGFFAESAKGKQIFIYVIVDYQGIYNFEAMISSGSASCFGGSVRAEIALRDLNIYFRPNSAGPYPPFDNRSSMSIKVVIQ